MYYIKYIYKDEHFHKTDKIIRTSFYFYDLIVVTFFGDSEFRKTG